MSPATSTRQALARTFEDASRFPPGDTALLPAWEAHLRWSAGEHRDLVGRFLVPAARPQQLAPMVEPTHAVELGIVAAAEQPDDVAPLLDGPAEAKALEALPELHAQHLEHAPRWFTSFGTCSIAEPLEGLEALGLLDA
jgi:hypothetical protein